MFSITIILIIINISLVIPQKTLQQVHVIFRHGDKTPETLSMYPKDPYLNDTWHPYGRGTLNNHGKMAGYKIGLALRSKYNNFLGKVYLPDIQYARSTNTDRTKMTMQLVLAGLWPPTLSQYWNLLLPWQPIPTDTFVVDELLDFPFLICPRYFEEYLRVQMDDDVQQFKRANKELLDYTALNSGLSPDLIQMFKLYNLLFAEEKNRRKLPDWTKKVYPEFLNAATLHEYHIMTKTDTMIQLSGGKFLSKIIKDAKAKIDNTLEPKDRKLFIYAGHDFNIVFILKALGLYKPHIPPYASYITIELHKIDNEYGFLVFYQDYSKMSPQKLTIPGCSVFCPINQLISLVKRYLSYDNLNCIL